MIEFDSSKLKEEDVIDVLNDLQKNKWIRILDYGNLTIKLRDKISKIVEESSDLDFDKFISEYRALFKGTRVGSMGTSITVNKNMREFMLTYPQYSKEHILKATKAYIESCSSENYKYLKQADYTIFKNQDFTRTNKTSTLLQWCEEIEENDYKEKKTNEISI